MRIIVIEDDPILGDAIRAGLKQRGFSLDWFTTAEDGQLALDTGSFQALVLDIGLPGISGLQLLKKLRSGKDTIPTLLLTARDTVEDRVVGLDSGADDYLIKPFSMDELAARLRAIIRRRSGQSEGVLKAFDLELDPASRKVTLCGKVVELSSREFSILHQLLLSASKIVSRERLEENLYGFNEEVESNAVEVHVHHLRKKLGSTLIRTVRGVGYIIDGEKDS